MTEPADTGATDDSGQQQDTGSNYTPPATQADLDRIIADRVNRTKAQYKDYNNLKSAAAELEKIKTANQTELERAQQAAQQAAERAATFAQTAVRNRIEALAAVDYAVPSDAVLLLDPKQYVSDDGVIDDAGITAALAAELQKRPSWRREQAPRVPGPNFAQGTSGSAAIGSATDQMNSLIRAARAR